MDTRFVGEDAWLYGIVQGPWGGPGGLLCGVTVTILKQIMMLWPKYPNSVGLFNGRPVSPA
jgi:hypothetical protein